MSTMKSKMLLGIILFLLVGGMVLSKDLRKDSSLKFRLGEEIILHKGEVARLMNGERDLTVEIESFYNQPCEGQCFWSGLGVVYKYTSNGEEVSGLNLSQAFGYQLRTIDSDYTTYSKIVLEKIQEN